MIQLIDPLNYIERIYFLCIMSIIFLHDIDAMLFFSVLYRLQMAPFTGKSII